MSERDIFEKIIGYWLLLRDESRGLTLNQLANVTLALGSSRNAARVGRVIHEFQNYFIEPRMGGRHFKVNWPAVKQDHPHLFAAPNVSIGTIELSAVDRIRQALRDEISAVREQTRRNPLIAYDASLIARLGPASFLYRSGLDLSDDREFSIPDGVKIRLRWAGSVHPARMDAILLSYDQLRSEIYFETECSLTAQQELYSFHVEACIEELLNAVQNRVETALQNGRSLAKKALKQNLE